MSDKKDGPFHNPFAALQGKLQNLPEGPRPSTVSDQKPSEKKGPARAVVRYERKGHGGKEATRVEQLELPVSVLETWLKELKQSLGCGGRVDDGALVLQGDQRERLPKLLTDRGVRKVTVG